MNTAARAFDVLLDPANLLGLAVMVAALLSLQPRRASSALRILRLVAMALLAFVLLPVDTWLLQPLERRFPATPLPQRVDGIMVLGGSQQPQLTEATGRAGINERAERMTTFLALARQHPRARLVFAGGSVDPERKFSEADTMRVFLREQGFDDTRVLFESQSRNTWENVINAEKLVQPGDRDNWLLVTSAADVPRAIGVFRRVGWRMIPVPVDFRVVPDGDWRPSLRLSATFARTYEGLHEWVGMLAYFLLGRTETLFPAP